MRSLDEILDRVDKRKGNLTRQDIADLKSLYLAKTKDELKVLVKTHFGKFLGGEKRGKKNIDAVMDDLDSYVD